MLQGVDTTEINVIHAMHPDEEKALVWRLVQVILDDLLNMVDGAEIEIAVDLEHTQLWAAVFLIGQG